MFNFLFEKTPLNYLFQSVWRDEAFSYLLAKKGILQILSLSAQDFSPPLYPLLLKLWIFALGSSEIAMRSLSLLAYLLTFYFFYNFLVKILKTDRVWTIIYSVLFFINPFLNYYAFEARAYSLFSLFTIASFYYFLTKKKAPYIIVTVLGLYTHYFMVLVVIAQIAYLFLNKSMDRERYKWLKNIGWILLLFTPWILFFLFQNKVVSDAFWIDKPTFRTLIRLPSILYLGYEGNFNFFRENIYRFSYFLYFLILGGAWWTWQKNKHRDLLILLLSWVFLPSLLIFFVSFIKPVFFPRYLILAASGSLLLLVFLAEQFKSYAKFIILALLFLVTFIYNNQQVKNRKKAPIRQIVKDIKVLTKEDDLIYTTDILNFHPAQYYFGEDRVFVYNKAYNDIPAFVGRVLIPKEKVAQFLPLYPRRAVVLNEDLSYNIQSID